MAIFEWGWVVNLFFNIKVPNYHSKIGQSISQKIRVKFYVFIVCFRIFWAILVRINSTMLRYGRFIQFFGHKYTVKNIRNSSSGLCSTTRGSTVLRPSWELKIRPKLAWGNGVVEWQGNKSNQTLNFTIRTGWADWYLSTFSRTH